MDERNDTPMNDTSTQADTAAEEVTEEQPTEPTDITISVENPNKEEMATICEDIAVDYDFDVDVKPTIFNFKKSTDKVTKVETTRDAVHLPIPYPSVVGIVAILENKDENGNVREGANKGLELLQDAMADVINARARDLLYEDTTLNAGTFPTKELAWEIIANIPKVQRRGGGIPKETWDAFAEDYCAVMPSITGKTLEQVGNMVKIFLNKLSQVRTAKPILQLTIEQLAIYAEASDNIEEYQECVAFLANKAEGFLNVTEEELLASL